MTIKRFEFNMFPVNCYVLWDETKEAVIIDAGCFYPSEQKKLKDFITTNDLKVKYVLNTHLHLDHVFGNAFLARELGILPVANAEDEFLLPKIAEYCHQFGFQLNEEPPALGGHISDGDIITFGNTSLKVIHTPGHSPGSVVFHHEESHSIFSGDVLFRCSIGRSDLDGGSHSQLINSIQSKLLILPDETTVYPGHGEPTQIGFERMNNPFFN